MVLQSRRSCPCRHVLTRCWFFSYLLPGVSDRYMECAEKVRKGGGDNAIARHTQRNKKLLVRDRLGLLLDGKEFLELSPFAGLGLPYGDIPSAGCVTGKVHLGANSCYMPGHTCEGTETIPHLINVLNLIMKCIHF